MKAFVVRTPQNFWEIQVYCGDKLVEVIPTSVSFARLLIEQAGKRFPDKAGRLRIRIS